MTSRALAWTAAAAIAGASTIAPALRAQQAPAPPMPKAAPSGENALVAKARGIHDRVIALDTHNDISPNNAGSRRKQLPRTWRRRSTCRR